MLGLVFVSKSTQVKVERRSELVVPTARLAVVEGMDRGAAIDVVDEVTVGQDPSATLVLRDPAVSRMHCAILPQVNAWRLRDLQSTNGTQVAGVRVLEALVAPGQRIEIGDTVLELTTTGTVVQTLSGDNAWGRALGTSAAMRRLFALMPRIAASDAVVLLEGETGTGKTLLAETIHRHSARSGGPFVVVDCGAISPTLIESELFGHEKGSFTGAVAQRVGAFERARGGTVFFDELGELPLDLQPKLLRALEDRVVRRVGGGADIGLDVRVIAATNRDLRAEVNKKTFRSDLFYRLNTIRVRVPALRERPEDVTLLAEHFWQQLAPDGPRPPAELLDELARRAWPGNVRELRAAVERAFLLGDPDELASDSSPAPAVELVEGKPFRAVKEQAVARWEKAYVRALVDQHSGNVSAAARFARMDRNHLRDLLRRHWEDSSED